MCGFAWASGVAMRFRTMQAGPLMQMPVFLTLFFAPVYVPLALLSGCDAYRRARESGHVRAGGRPRLHLGRAGPCRARLCPRTRARRWCSRRGPFADCGRPRRRAPSRASAQSASVGSRPCGAGQVSRSRSVRRGTGRERTLRFSRRTPSGSSCACSTTTTRKPALSSPSRRCITGMRISRKSRRDSVTATGSTAPGPPSRVIASTRTSCSSTRTRRRSRAPCNGTAAARSPTRTATTSSWTKATTPRRFRSRS